MFPRMSRLLRLALAVGLTLFVILVLRSGGGGGGGGGSSHVIANGGVDPQGTVLLPHHMVPGRREMMPGSLTGAIRNSQPPGGAPLLKLRAVKGYLNTSSNNSSNKGSSSGSSNKTVLSTATEKRTTAEEVDEANKINPHPFAYLINPEHTCSGGRTSAQGNISSQGVGVGRAKSEESPTRLLVYVHSAPANLKKRMSIRQTWGERSVLKRYNASLVFIMGTVPDPLLMDLLQREHEAFGDIVQEDFRDTYRNLTYKAIAGLKWAAKFCPSATYILKSDDDILVNLPLVADYIRTVVAPQYGASKLILCNQWVRMKIIRDSKSKWYIPESDLKGDYFSPYCSGSAFLLSGDMAGLLYRASLDTPFFWVDDFYITGTLIQRIKVQHKSLNKAYSLNPGVAEGKFTNDTKHELFFFHLHKLRLMYAMWRRMALDARLITTTTTTTTTAAPQRKTTTTTTTTTTRPTPPTSSKLTVRKTSKINTNSNSNTNSGGSLAAQFLLKHRVAATGA